MSTLKIYQDVDLDTTFRAVIRHFGHPINNWGYQIYDKENKLVLEDMQVSQYSFMEAFEECQQQFLIRATKYLSL